MDGKTIARTAWLVMKALGRGLCRLVLSVLILYWLIFIGYTVTNYVRGGYAWVVAWYAHISGNVFEPWNWKVFLWQQVFALALTLCFAYLEWWHPKQVR